jgi:hypothetical protein
MHAGLTTPSDAVVMQAYLEPLILACISKHAPVCRICWENFPLATSYAAYVATVYFDGSSDTRKVFAKNFGATVRPKDAPKQRREREVQVYRELLEGAELGTARYYGSILDEPEQRFWLLLEFVDGTPVGYCDIPTSWAPAAAALGRLHGRFARETDLLSACDFLKWHDAAFFWSKAEEAIDAVARCAPHLIDHVAALVKRYGAIVDMMAGQPVTLIHGGCRPSNILIRITSDSSRVCIVDWEEAGAGPSFLDLAYLLDGIEPPLLDRLLEAYRQEVLAYGIAVPEIEEMKYLVDCFRLHMTFNSLSQSVLKGYQPKAVEKLVGIADRLDRVVHRAPSQHKPAAAVSAAVVRPAIPNVGS